MLDQIGTPKELIDSNGGVAWQAKSNLWGDIEEIVFSKTDCPIRFQGQYYDDESKLTYNWHRYYDSCTGRYLTLDPLGLECGPNPYSYVANPLKSIDPFGLMDCDGPPDPGLDDFIRALEARGVKVLNKNVKIFKPNGDAFGEIDVVTEHALIQYKNGTSSAFMVIKQVQVKTEPFVNRPVVVFIGNTGRAGRQTVNQAKGKILISNDIDEFAGMIK